MKLKDILLPEAKDDDDDDDWPTAKLKNLSKHIYNGRVFVNSEDADAALQAADEAKPGEGDVCMWHDWLSDSDSVYEITFAATDFAAIKRVLSAVKKAVPRAHLFMATKKSGEVIEHRDWRDYM